MKKLAANYVVSNSGDLLKNGVLIADDNGNVLEIVDTKGDLDEMAQLTFHNGILIANKLYTRTNSKSTGEDELGQFINLKINRLQQLATTEIIDIAKQIQAEFPELKTPEIMAAIFSLLDNNFSKNEQSGVFLLIHSDLVGLHFRPASRLKQVL